MGRSAVPSSRTVPPPSTLLTEVVAETVGAVLLRSGTVTSTVAVAETPPASVTVRVRTMLCSVAEAAGAVQVVSRAEALAKEPPPELVHS